MFLHEITWTIIKIVDNFQSVNESTNWFSCTPTFSCFSVSDKCSEVKSYIFPQIWWNSLDVPFQNKIPTAKWNTAHWCWCKCLLLYIHWKEIQSSGDRITAQCSPADESNTLRKITTNSAFIFYKWSTL